MTTDARRAVVLAIGVLAVVALVLFVRTGPGPAPAAVPPRTADPAPSAAASAGPPAPAPPAVGALDAATAIAGRVVDGGGRPVAGARVFLDAPSRGMNAPVGLGPDWESAPAATTDAGGRFRIGTRVRYGHLRVKAAGFAPLDLRVAQTEPPPESTEVGDVALAPGLTLEGRVLDGEGRPMPGVRLDVDDERCTSDELGCYRIPDLAPGRHRIRAVAERRDQIQRGVTLARGRDPAVLDLAFPAGREVTVEVRDPSGAPVAGAGVDVVHRHIWEQTDAQGRAVVVVPPGPWGVRVAAGRHRHGDGRPVFVAREAAIPADAVRLAVTLDRTPTPEAMLPVAGTVVDDGGRPVDGVLLEVSWEGRDDPSQRSERVHSGEDGRFSVRVPKDALCDVRVNARVRRNAPPSKVPRHDPWVGGSTGVSAGSADAVVVARPDPRDRAVTVLALAPDGAPVEGCSVHLSGTWVGNARAGTGGDGRAAFAGLCGVAYSVSVDPPDHRSEEWLPGHAPEFVPDGREVVVRLRRAARIAGTVLLADGSPARGAYVTFTAGSARQDESVDAAGRFRLHVDAALPLPWRLTAAHRDDWPPIEASVDLAAPPSGEVVLRIPDATRR